MGKKTKKNRFNRSVDVDIVYSSNTIADMDPTDNLAELNISKEKAEELQKLRARLPAFSNTSLLDTELAKLPTEKPFRAFVHNVSYSATEQDVFDLFAPLKITNINMVSGESGSRGFCFIDFDTREDLAKALERSDSILAGRPINVRIAGPTTNETNVFGRERTSFGGPRRGDGTFERRRGGTYRPAALRNEFNDVSDGTGGESAWRRGAVSFNASSNSSSGSNLFGQSRPFEPRHSAFKPSNVNEAVERPKLNIIPRSSARDPNEVASQRDPKIFGDARPVDTTAKDREVEERLATSSRPAQAIPTIHP